MVAKNWGLVRTSLCMAAPDKPHPSQPLTPEQRIKELEVQLKEARENAQLFEAVLDVLKKDYGVRIVKKPLGKSSRKDPSKA